MINGFRDLTWLFCESFIFYMRIACSTLLSVRTFSQSSIESSSRFTSYSRIYLQFDVLLSFFFISLPRVSSHLCRCCCCCCILFHMSRHNNHIMFLRRMFNNIMQQEHWANTQQNSFKNSNFYSCFYIWYNSIVYSRCKKKKHSCQPFHWELTLLLLSFILGATNRSRFRRMWMRHQTTLRCIDYFIKKWNKCIYSDAQSVERAVNVLKRHCIWLLAIMSYSCSDVHFSLTSFSLCANRRAKRVKKACFWQQFQFSDDLMVFDDLHIDL